MTRKKKLIRQFRKSDDELTQKIDRWIKAAVRDAVPLRGYGLKQDHIDTTQKLRDDFTALPTDEEIVALGTIVTNKKAEAHIALEGLIKDALSRIVLQFGKKSPQLKLVGGEAITALSDAKLCQKGRRIERTCRQYAEELKEAGLTPEMIDALKIAVDAFDDLIDEQKEQAVQRDLKTRERIEKANALYEAGMKLHNYGKAAFEFSNPALYQSYIIDDSRSKKSNGTGETEEDLDEASE